MRRFLVGWCLVALACVARADALEKAVGGLWSARLPLSEAALGSECEESGIEYGVLPQHRLDDPRIDLDLFSWHSVEVVGEVLRGLCLDAAGLPELAAYRYREASRNMVEALGELRSYYERQQKDIDDRRSRVATLSTLASLFINNSRRIGPSERLLLNQVLDTTTRSEFESIARDAQALQGRRPGELTASIRVPVLPLGGFLHHVVKVVSADSYCTGSFVGPDIVLTNLHCVHPGMRVVQDVLIARKEYAARTWWTARGERGTLTPEEASTGRCMTFCDQDWALIELTESRPDPDDYLRVASHSPEVEKVMVAGYSGDVSGGRYITLDIGCPARAGGAAFSFTCSTYKGSSGSPVLSVHDQRVVVALNNAGTFGGNTANERSAVRAVRTETFYPTLQRLFTERRLELPAAPTNDARTLLVGVAQRYRERQQKTKLPAWKD